MKACKPLPNANVIRALLCYDPTTGLLYWRCRNAKWFTSGVYPPERVAAAWNAAHADHVAGSINRDTGYTDVSVLGEDYRAHRIIWVLEYGHDPENQVDHENGNRSDNRLLNLRAASPVDNSRNQKLRSDNTSGCAGVSWDVRKRLWRARIGDKRRRKSVGRFKAYEDAVAAKHAAEQALGYHENHGSRR